jgi:hypothetical protein
VKIGVGFSLEADNKFVPIEIFEMRMVTPSEADFAEAGRKHVMCLVSLNVTAASAMS